MFRIYLRSIYYHIRHRYYPFAKGSVFIVYLLATRYKLLGSRYSLFASRYSLLIIYD